jgi:hypothetical protein
VRTQFLNICPFTNGLITQLFLMMLVIGAGDCRADTIFSNLNLSSSEPWKPNYGVGIGLQDDASNIIQGVRFDVSRDYYLDTIEVPISLIQGSSAFDLWLMTDIWVTPSWSSRGIIEIFHYDGALEKFGSLNQLVTFRSDLQPLLDDEAPFYPDGKPYYLVAVALDSLSSLAWCSNTIYEPGRIYSVDNGATWEEESGFRWAPALQVSGHTIPEPSTITLLGIGLGMMCLQAWRRKDIGQ